MTKKSGKKGKSKGWIIEMDEDVEKLGNILCGTRKKHSAKALRRIHESAELDDLAHLVKRYGARFGLGGSSIAQGLGNGG